MRVCIASENEPPQFLTALQARHDVECISITTPPRRPLGSDVLIVSADLRIAENIDDIRKVLARATSARKRLFVLKKKTHLSIVQAFALGATHLIAEPVKLNELMHIVEGSPLVDAGIAADAADTAQSVLEATAPFASLFMAAVRGETPKLADAADATDLVYDAIVTHGLTQWIENVRRHHKGTFQHCLLVTGCAIDFGCNLGFSRTDVQRVGLMATLHDVGKARIPVEILDKPQQLDAAERVLMETHSRLGYETLRAVDGISDEVLDGVLHHHEYLDGTGYPDGLSNGQISDPVRLLTIADIFSALIEFREYRPPMSRRMAYDVLQGMAGKLESPLVRAFHRVALEC